MNVGSMQLAGLLTGSPVGNNAQTNAKAGGMFGAVLASTTLNSDVSATATKNDELGALMDIVSELLTGEDKESLISALAELTGISQEQIKINFDGLNQSSSLEDWMTALELDTAELMTTITSILEEAGISKEQLAEVTYSNDVWTLMNALTEHAPAISEIVGRMMSEGDQKSQQQATDLLALLKSVETILPTKDLIGWQQTSLTQLSEQLGAIQEVVKQFITANTNVTKFSGLLQVKTIQNVKIPGLPVVETSKVENVQLNQSKLGEVTAVLDTPKAVKTEVEQTNQRTILPSMTVVSENSQSGTKEESKSEQNQTQLLQNQGVQPIVTRNVFSLETPQAKPASQAEELLIKLQGLFKQANFGQVNGTNRLLVKLYPEHLGQIRIELVQTNGVMTARILASTALGKQMLDSQLHQLRQSFSQQNIQVDRIDVTQAAQDPSRNERNNQFSQQQFKQDQEQQEQHNENDSEEQQSFQEFLVEIDLEV